MLTLERRKDIEDLADEILKKYSYTQDAVRIIEIINNGYGYNVVEKNLENNVAGQVNHVEKSIYVNKNDNAGRQRFTLAHELGHIVLNKNGKIQNRLNNNIFNNQLCIYTDNTDEEEANYFAGCILMPKDKYKFLFKQTDGDVDYISNYFAVSRLAAFVRGNVLELIKTF